MAIQSETRPAPAALPPVPGTRTRGTRVLAVATAVAMALLLYGAFVYAPGEASQGPPQRIFYIHVPSAWIGFLAFFGVFVSSILLLVKRDRRYDRFAAASAEVGVIFTTGVLITGPLWARPIWGVYWSWDPRLTSFFVLWLLYLSYLALRSYVQDPERRARYSAVLGIVAFLDVPIVYLSVRWWRSLHPGPVVTHQDGPQLPSEMLYVLLTGLVAFTLFYVLLVRMTVQAAARREELEEQQMRSDA